METIQIQPVLDAASAAISKTSSNLLTTEEAAALLDVSAGTLNVWRCTRRYPLAFVKVGAKVRYRREDIDRFIALRTRSGVGSDRRAPGRGRR